MSELGGIWLKNKCPYGAGTCLPPSGPSTPWHMSYRITRDLKVWAFVTPLSICSSHRMVFWVSTCHVATRYRRYRRSGVPSYRMVSVPSGSDQPFGRYSQKSLDIPAFTRKSSYARSSSLTSSNLEKFRLSEGKSLVSGKKIALVELVYLLCKPHYFCAIL